MSQTRMLNLREAVHDLARPRPPRLLIEASAGTGKTYALERLILGLVVVRRLPIASILALTFTEKATAELKERVRGRLADLVAGDQAGLTLAAELGLTQDESATWRTAARTALADFDQAAILTIHGFCHRVVSENFFALGRVPLPGNPATAGERVAAIIHDSIVNYLYNDPPSALVAESLLALARTQDWLAEPLAGLSAKVHAFIAAGYFDTGRYQFDWAGLGLAAELVVEGAKTSWPLTTNLARAARAFRTALARLDQTSLKLPQTFHRRLETLCQLDRRSEAVLFDLLPNKDLRLLWEKLTATKKNAVETGRNEALVGAVGAPIYDDLCDALGPWWEALRDLQARVLAQAGYPPILDIDQPWYWEPILVHAGLSAIAQKVTAALDLARLSEGLLDYDGMIDLVARSLEAGDHLIQPLRNRYRALLVDEFQDTDARQWAIFRRVFVEAPDWPVVLVGDPKQSIYGFRGADWQVYQTAAESLGAAARRDLAVNYRSTPSLIAATNQIFEAVAAKYGTVFPGFWPVQPSPDPPTGRGPAVRLVHLGHQVDAPNSFRQRQGLWFEAIGGGIRELCADGRPLGDLAILTETNAQAYGVARFLRDQGIPARVEGKGSLATGPSATSLALFAQALAEPDQPGRIRALAFSALVACPVELIEARHLAIGLRVQTACQIFDRQGFLEAYEAFIAAEEPRLARVAGGLDQLGDWRRLAALFDGHCRADQVRRERLGQVYSPWLGQLEGLDSYHGDDEAVRIMTLHASKGLEFPVVFFCPAFRAVNRTRRAWHPAVLDGPGGRRLDPLRHPDNALAIRSSALAERLRLGYVGLTRAIEALYLPVLARKVPADRQTAVEAVVATLAGDFPPAPKESVPPPPSRTLPATLSTTDEPWSLIIPQGGHGQAGPVPAIPMKELTPQLLSTDFAGAGTWTQPAPYRSLSDQRPRVRHPHRSSYTSLIRHWPETPMDLPEASELPSGPLFGTLVHSLFDRIPWPSLIAGDQVYHEGVRDLAQDLGWGSREVDRWAPLLRQLMAQTMASPLGPGLRVGELGPLIQASELGFTWAIAASPGGPVLVDDRQVLDWLGFGDGDLRIPRGFLTGSIDLVFERENALAVVDWKTNRLLDYSPTNLDRQMGEVHYYRLQALIYLAVLGRAFPDRRLDAAYYVFMRAAVESPEGLAAVVRCEAEPALIARFIEILEAPND